VNPGWDLIHHFDEYRIMGIGERTKGKLDGKVAVVTGASKGIGAGIAKVLAAQGASVIVNSLSSKEGAERVVAAITKARGTAIALPAVASTAAHG
jgi:3-oxoacyl-[acyl-carrier protein] reductase